MKIKAQNPDKYFEQVPDDKKEAMDKLRAVILENIPEGFEEQMSYGMPGYVVPHSIYPKGYHARPEEPLPFISIAAQKNFIGLYHLGIYANPVLLKWFQSEYAKEVPSKLDMGKSCIRLKKPDQVPYKLIGELCRKISVQDWIDSYESHLKG